MQLTRKISEDLCFLGASDRRLALFENIYPLPKGVSYNAYLITDQKTALIDTADRSISDVFFENLAHALNHRPLDYVVVQHMEPDHAATLRDLLRLHPETTIVCTAAASKMIGQFFENMQDAQIQTVGDGDTLSLGRHQLTFLTAPMVHWPEVMVTYDAAERTLFSADAFGAFGALDGHLFADEVDIERDWLAEMRRYYVNIVGKYGSQVQALLKKAAAVEIERVCPLHGLVWRREIPWLLDKYQHWSTYTPEEQGVLIVCGSIYGHTQNAADALANRLSELGVRKVAVYDVSSTHVSELLAEAFRYSHLVIAAATYNAGVFTPMECFLADLKAHNFQSRKVSLIENGSWACTAGTLSRKILSDMKNVSILNTCWSLRSAPKENQREVMVTMANEIFASMQAAAPVPDTAATVDPKALFALSYGLFVLTAKDGGKDNGCIINTVMQITDSPKRIAVCVNKQNHTHDMILRTGLFNVSVLSQEAEFAVFKRFGFQSGRDTDKFAGLSDVARSANGLLYLTSQTNALLSAKVISAEDCGTHTLFLADITEAKTLSAVPSVTYAYYFEHIKPKPQAQPARKRGFICKICGYFYEGDTLPEDFICPLCKHGAEDFEPVGF